MEERHLSINVPTSDEEVDLLNVRKRGKEDLPYDEDSVVLLGNVSHSDSPIVDEQHPHVPVIEEEPIDEAEKKTKSKKPKKTRLIALDILRGMTVFSMIIVNNQPQEPTYWTTGHADFNGITPTDFIFPFFLWIMGYAMGIVFSRKVHNPNEIVYKWRLLKMRRKTSFEISKWIRIFRRAILLFFFGFFASVLSHLFDFRKVRILGVLQRISICYFIVTLILTLIPWFFVQILIVLNLHLIYIFFMFFFPTPGCGAGNITPECSAEGYFDTLILGKDHIYWKTKYFDPEGLLSTLTAISTTFLGVLYYKVSRIPEKGDHYRLITLWMVFSFFLIVFGMFLNEVVSPYNKHIWSSAFVFVTAGTAGVFLSVITWIADVNRWKCWAYVFLWVGVNPLFMYIVPSYIEIILSKIPVKDSNLYMWIFNNALLSWIKNVQVSDVLFGLCFESVFLPFAWFFYWRKIYIKL